MSQGKPHICTGMMARVRGVMAAAIRSMSMLWLRGSMSANTGVAPTSMMTFAVATQEFGVVITSSPGPMPAMRKAISMVQVPELKVRTGRPEKYSDRRDSKAFTFGPLLVSQPERRTSVTPAMVASSMEGRVKGRKGNAEGSIIGELYRICRSSSSTREFSFPTVTYGTLCLLCWRDNESANMRGVAAMIRRLLNFVYGSDPVEWECAYGLDE